MNKKITQRILQKHNLGQIKSYSKINIGYTNKVYSVNDEYILKVCEDMKNEVNFAKEVFLYQFFKNKIPVPDVIIFDQSKTIYGKSYMIYKKIHGDNVYSIWHLITNQERRMIIQQLCSILRIINESSYKPFAKKFQLDSKLNWHDKVINQINHSLMVLERRKVISQKLIQSIQYFVETNHNCLCEQKITLVFWDAHFDNILVKNNTIVGVLDFERTDLSSLDFNLDIIKRMVDYPTKYMSEQFEKYAKKEDYVHLLTWFREFYPELFEFKDLHKRLDLYAIMHDLDTLIDWPNSKETKQMIAKVVKD